MKKPIVRFAALGLGILLAGGCTGDWNRDSIFFSQKKAQLLLDQESNALAAAEANLQSARNETQSLEAILRSEKVFRQLSEDEVKKVQADAAHVDSRIQDARRDLAKIEGASAGALERRRKMESEVADLEKQMDELRDALRILLTHR